MGPVLLATAGLAIFALAFLPAPASPMLLAALGLLVTVFAFVWALVGL